MEEYVNRVTICLAQEKKKNSGKEGKQLKESCFVLSFYTWPRENKKISLYPHQPDKASRIKYRHSRHNCIIRVCLLPLTTLPSEAKQSDSTREHACPKCVGLNCVHKWETDNTKHGHIRNHRHHLQNISNCIWVQWKRRVKHLTYIAACWTNVENVAML